MVQVLAEDNSDDAELTLMASDASGVGEREIELAVDGEEALSLIGGRPDATDLPALTLPDLKRPKRSGLEVMRELRADARGRPLSVVIRTSSLEFVDAVAAYELGIKRVSAKTRGLPVAGRDVPGDDPLLA